MLIGEVVRAFAASAEAGGVQLKVEVEGDLPILEIDPVRIREVMANLVANALRHTPRGGTVAIGGSATDERVTILVRDTGSGIEPGLFPHVFERFVKSSASRGSGLGLAIAKALVEAHGGSIAVDSTVGVGTTFRLELPHSTSG